MIAFVSALMLGSGAWAVPDRSLSEKLLRTFRESFPVANGLSWRENLHSYTVDFQENNVHIHIVYAKNGDFFRSMRYYSGEDLPYYLQTVIQKKYPNKKIFGVVEMADGRGVSYLLKARDGKILTTIRMANEGTLELFEK